MSGATESWTECHRLYPSDEWTLSLHLRGSAALDVAATANEDKTYALELTANDNDSDPLGVGTFYYQIKVTNIADTNIKKFIDSGSIQVLADLSSDDLDTFDGRTKAQVMVEAIDAMLAKKATRDQQSFTIGQRTLQRMTPEQLLKWRQYYADIVASERVQARVKNGQSPFENIVVEFVSE